MEENYTESKQPREENKSVRHRKRSTLLRRYFQKLKEKYTMPGDDRPGPRYYLAVTAVIVLISWWMFSFLVEILRAHGRFQEGTAGFVVMFIERTGFVSFGIWALALLKKTSSKKDNWKWWIAVVCFAAGVFIGLRNPIRDIPYLFHPAETVIRNWKLDVDSSYRYSTYYHLKGQTAEGQNMIFHINRSTLHDPPFSEEDETLVVEYLPYTEMVMSITAS
ncbi:MAG: hypothetical protein ACOYBC_10885 [Bilifractor sp.]